MNSTMINFDKTSMILEVYITRPVGSLGILFNLFTLVILSNKKIKNNFYNFLWCRVFWNLCTCILSSVYLNYLDMTYERSYLYMFLAWYIINIPLRITLFCSLFSDIFLIFNRLVVILQNKKSLIAKLSKKANLVLSCIIPLIFSWPAYFSVRIVKKRSGDFYGWELTEFGSTKFLLSYAVIIFLLESIIPVVVLSVLNLISINKFRETLRKRCQIIRRSRACEKAISVQGRFCRLTVILTTICVITRTLDMASGILSRLSTFNIVKFSQYSRGMIKVFGSSTFLVLILANSFDGILYYIMDRNMWNFLRELVLRCWIKVNIIIDFK